MNRIGANAWIWHSPVTDELIGPLATRLARWGFDLIELPLENPGDWDPGRTRDVLHAHGLGGTVCAAMGPDRDLVTSDDAVVASTQDYLRGCIDAAATIGSPVVGGPMYAPVGKAWRMSGEERGAVINRLVGSLKPVADYAGERGVRLGVEPLNRFETSVLNTVEQALEVLDRVGSPACGFMVDTFHLNIEEKDPPAAIRSLGSHIAHVQVCGNDRGAPGSDHIDWPATLRALRDAGYDGALAIESFTAENQTIATAASIWRPLERSQDAIATDGLAFLRAQLRAFGEGQQPSG